MCKIGSVISFITTINRNITQGSGSGITIFYNGRRLTSIFTNLWFKYTDDANLLVPENTDVCLLEEFEHIKKWARTKILSTCSRQKKVSFVFLPLDCRMPPQLNEIDQVTEIKLFRVISITSHIIKIMQRIYLNKLLRDQGLCGGHLDIVLLVIIISIFSHILTVSVVLSQLNIAKGLMHFSNTQ